VFDFTYHCRYGAFGGILHPVIEENISGSQLHCPRRMSNLTLSPKQREKEIREKKRQM
jgi:hypothetical protein